MLWLFMAPVFLVTGQPLEVESEHACAHGWSWHHGNGVCLENPPPLDRPSVFLGCERHPSDCAYFGFEYEGSYETGNGHSCDNVTNVRCVSKKAPPLDAPSSASELRAASYNIWERPFWITMDGQRERSCRIPREIAENHGDIDVIGFQETFMGGCWSKQASIRDLLTQHGFRYHTKTVDDIKPKHVLNGGIYIASRWPIVEEDQFSFEASDLGSWDFFSSKGVAYAKINKTSQGESRVYHVMATHFQAGDAPRHSDFRVNQSREWGEFVKAKNIPRNEAVIFMGDFNVHYESQQDDLAKVLDNLGAVIPVRTDPDPSRSWIDYVMYSKNHKIPVSANQHFLNLRDAPFPVCWCSICPWLRGYVYPEAPGCKNIVQRETLSDHRPIYATLIF